MKNETLEFHIPRSISLKALKEKIKTRFPIKEEAAQSIGRVYQDTFEWQLFKKGYIYSFDEVNKEEKYVTLLNTKSGNKQVLLVDNLPIFCNDFASHVFRRKMTPLLGIRALTSKLELKIRRYPMRYVDDDDKTRLDVFIDEYRLMLPTGKVYQLDKRVIISPVKGYSKPQKMLSSCLEKELHLPRAVKPVFVSGLDYCAIKPGDVSSSVDTKLDPSERTDKALKLVLSNALEMMELTEDGVIKNIDTEYLHDFRVSVRRSRSVLSQIKAVFPLRALEKYQNLLKWVGDITGPTRDMHVYLLKFDGYRSALPARMRPHLDSLHEFLVKHLAIEHAQLVRNLKSSKYRNFKKNWRDYLKAPVPERTSLASAKNTVKQTADFYIWRAFNKALKQGSAITKKCPDEKLHRLRITCKKLRYLLEIFNSLYSQKKLKPLLKSLKLLQNVLGDFQDLSVQIDALQKFEQQMNEENMLTAEAHVAMETLAGLLRIQIKDYRVLFEESFLVFSSTDNKTMYKSLFKPEKA